MTYPEQCIWPTTTKVGIALAKASNGATYIVGRYTPPGNWMGQTAYGTAAAAKSFAAAAATEEKPAESSEYTVADGDSMSDISQKLDVSLDDLKARNPQIEGPDFVVRKGDVLTIPCKSSHTQFGVKVLSSIQSSGGGYVVVPGDSLWAIAQKLGVELSALQAANPDVRPPDYQVNVGQTLNIPGQGGNGGSQKYTVAAGDTMFSIAERSGVSLQDLQNANPQVKGPDYVLHEGDVLTIPAGGHAPSGPPPPASGGIVHYSGPSSNFPGPDKWVSWETMSAHNAQVMNTTGNSAQETQWVLDTVVSVSGEVGLDRRCILAVIMQESHGKVRVNSTTSPGAGVNNTGIMQAHNGASFNEADPQGSILRMVRDGAGGVPGPTGGDGYKQLLDRYNNDFFVAARGYNSGDLGINFQDLSSGGGATNSYCSDLANRLCGVDPN